MLRHIAVQTQPTEPSLGKVEMHLLAQSPLRPDAEAVAHKQHPDHQLRVDLRPADRAVERRYVLPHTPQIH